MNRYSHSVSVTSLGLIPWSTTQYCPLWGLPLTALSLWACLFLGLPLKGFSHKARPSCVEPWTLKSIEFYTWVPLGYTQYVLFPQAYPGESSPARTLKGFSHKARPPCVEPMTLKSFEFHTWVPLGYTQYCLLWGLPRTALSLWACPSKDFPTKRVPHV